MVSGRSRLRLGLLAVFCLICVVLAFKNSFKPGEFDLSHLPPLKKGDLIFRLGNSKDSLIISAVSDFKYSHVGVYLGDDLVIHSAPLSEININDGVSIVTFSDFLLEAVDFGVARVRFLDENSSELFIENLKSHIAEPFKLENKESENLYCSTFIANELAKISEFNPEYKQVNIPLVGGEFLFPKGIWQDKNVEIIYEYQ